MSEKRRPLYWEGSSKKDFKEFPVAVQKDMGHRQVNASIVDPAFIANVRKKLALDQREAAEIFGGGINAFSRYENGKTKPPLALVQLFKVLDRHPELLDEIRAA
jgi:HTH-type transcriptional regulator/antitoxin MqsA